MIRRFFELNDDVKRRVDLCRYADVPICNIESSDFAVFISDIFLARRLQKADMILWCSSSSKPDLGGSEQADNTISLGKFNNIEFNSPGTYDTICIEMEVWDLALNTFIQISQHSEAENLVTSSIRGNGYLLDSHFANPEDSNTTLNLNLNNGSNDSLHHVLVIIRGLVKQWLKEVREDKGNK